MGAVIISPMHTTFVRLCCILAALFVAPVLPAAGTAPKSDTPAKVRSAAKIDVNTADEATLETLPGIGPVTARAIIAARPFKSVDDLASVPGIGPAKLADLRDRVRVSHVSAASAKAKSAAETKDEHARTAKSERATTKSADATRGTSRGTTVSGTDRPLEPTGYPSTTRQTAPAAATGALINLNTATKEELESLPEIGPVKAQAIIDARPFSSKEDVMRVKGIKEGTFNVIKDRITVR